MPIDKIATILSSPQRIIPSTSPGIEIEDRYSSKEGTL
jgi:hypothetical protein